MGAGMADTGKYIAKMVQQIKRQVKEKGEDSFYADSLLPAFRYAEQCCATCQEYDAGWEGEGDCRMLYELIERFRKEIDSGEIFIDSSVVAINICDRWKKADKTN